MLELLNEPIWLLSLGGIFGLLVGSFLNVVIYRLPVMMHTAWRDECAAFLSEEDDAVDEPKADRERFDLIKPDSHCPKCKSPIKAWQNVPVLSYVIQGRKCASCSTPISARYPIVEAATALLTVFVLWQFGNTLQAAFAVLLCWGLITLTMIDVDHQLLPDSITLPLLWLGLIANSFGLFVDLHSAIWGAIAGYMSLWSVFWIFKLLTKKDGMGYGDFKLLAALGAWLGWKMLPLIIVLSSLVGAVLGSLMLLRKNQSQGTPIPFGPYLAVAGGIALFWGDSIVQAYLNYSGF
ncbi:MAG: A24 family peptidase [Pseudomonadota bacterium]